MRQIKLLWPMFLLMGFASCAQLHHVQMSEMDASEGNLVPFEIKVSETGISATEAAEITKAFTSSAKAKKTLDDIEAIIAMFQFGPTTGNPVYFTETYADDIFTSIRGRCPSGKVTGLVSIRESRKYPVISGEIVKVLGYCVETAGFAPPTTGL